MEKYDVFISCKSEDYKYAEEVYDYLVDEGILTFLASKELRKVGESEYRKAISKALKESSHIIVFASQAEYIESDWVEFEWDMFLNAKLKGKKQGNIITVLKEVDTDDIPMELWKYESFPFNDFKSKILKYVETEESKERRKEIQRKREAERLRSEEEKKKEAKRNELKSDLIWTAENYKRSLSSLQVDIDKIYRILHELGISQRECPICKNHITLEESYCSECGWPISPLDGIEELAYLNNNEDILKIYQKHYQENDAKKLRDFEDLQTAYETLKNKFQALQEENDKSKMTMRIIMYTLQHYQMYT